MTSVHMTFSEIFFYKTSNSLSLIMKLFLPGNSIAYYAHEISRLLGVIAKQ